MMLDHARLAKLLTASGASDASTNHIAEALKCAPGSERLSSITNEAQLFDINYCSNGKTALGRRWHWSLCNAR